MDESGLGCRVRELAAGRALHDAGDAGDVDDAGCVAGGHVPAFAEEGQEGGADEELGGHVCLEGFLPSFVLAFHEVLGD